MSVRYRFPVFAVACLGVAACASPTAGPLDGPKQTVGTVAGGVAGAVIGNQIGDGEGRAVATALGAVFGAVIGNQIGAGLDELDRQRASNAQVQALEFGRSGAPVTWRNPDSGNYGEVVPSSPYKISGADCRDYSHTVYIDGQPEVVRGSACRNPDGTWRPV